MFFYALLFLASIAAALVILQLYNSIASIGRTVYTAILPSTKDGVSDHLKGVPLNTTINKTRTPWGWKEHATPSSLAGAHPAEAGKQTPWGWPGNEKEIREHKPANQSSDRADLNSYLKYQSAKSQTVAEKKPSVGWPYLEDKLELAGNEYKVTPKTKLKRTNLSTTSKPWGW
jgi:hypothetical protein